MTVAEAIMWGVNGGGAGVHGEKERKVEGWESLYLQILLFPIKQ